jgi:hypothetical protein
VQTQCCRMEPTEMVIYHLMRYAPKMACSVAPGGYHMAEATIEAVLSVAELRVTGPGWDDARFPGACACGYRFQEDDERGRTSVRLWRRCDTGEVMSLRDAPVGAMWYADWMPDDWKGPDGHCLVVKLPNGHEWYVDSRASNCALPTDTAHKCWVRHGAPPHVTVDKNGLTCAAGAGSILSGGWHGFLRDGVLIEA